MHFSYTENGSGLERFFALFQAGSTLLTIEIVVWIVDIVAIP